MNETNLSSPTTLVLSNRIPKDYFITKGKGESNITIHAGSYHLALRNAGIEMCNILTYSSILPSIANEVSNPGSLIHGSVMETINAVAHSKKGKRATAGIMFGFLYDKITGENKGGLVCEYNGGKTDKQAVKELRESLNELYTNGYDCYDLLDIRVITETVIPKKRFGTAIVAICFINHVFPALSGKGQRVNSRVRMPVSLK